MNLEKKVNLIGKILADVQLEVSLIHKSVKEIRRWMLNPDELNARIEVEHIMQDERNKRT